MRTITGLSFETQSLLSRIYKMSKKHEARERSQCVLLSFKGLSINELVLIFDVHLNTIYNWLDNWESIGLRSLYHRKGQGRKPLLNSKDKPFVKELIEKYPKQIKKVVSELDSQKGIQVSVCTVSRFLKKSST